MENNEVGVVHRRTIVEVQQQPRHNGKRHKKHHHNHVIVKQQWRDDDKHDETNIDNVYTQPIPLELSPLITAAIEYGKKTHVLGALKAADVLLSIADKITNTIDVNELNKIADEARRASEKIKKDLEVIYDGADENI